MNEKKIVLGLVGSPNKEGRTNELVRAALNGASKTVVETELIQMSELVVDACRDCLPWVCHQNAKCTYDDKNFELLSRKILDCDGLILGTPVYHADTSGMVKYLFIKMTRIFSSSKEIVGLPAAGIAIAGNSGGGLTIGLRPVYRFFAVMGLRGFEPLPATQFDFEKATEKADELGYRIGEMADTRRPFSSMAEAMDWYDNLPYLNLNFRSDRRLLTETVLEALPEEQMEDGKKKLAYADELAEAGNTLDSLIEINGVYSSGINVLKETYTILGTQS